MSTWTLSGARQTAGGKWCVSMTRDVEPDTTLGELAATLAEATPRAYDAVITVDLRRRDRRIATASVYVANRDQARAAMADHQGPVTIHES